MTSFYRIGAAEARCCAKIRLSHVVFPHKMLIQLDLTREVEITDAAVDVGVAAGPLLMSNHNRTKACYVSELPD